MCEGITCPALIALLCIVKTAAISYTTLAALAFLHGNTAGRHIELNQELAEQARKQDEDAGKENEEGS